jgi:DNA replication protein DnaC
MSLPEKIKVHTDAMLLWGKQDLFIERRFTTAESWNRTSTEESFRFRGIFRDREPVLQQLLSHSNVLILGEPGSGKSSIAKAAVHKLASSGNSTPVPALLKSYRGNLRHLLEQSTPPQILDAASTHRTYVLDGLDEVPSSFIGPVRSRDYRIKNG